MRLPADADPWGGCDPGGCAGVDEVGRGCLFGPVYAGAVVIPAAAIAPLQAQGPLTMAAATAEPGSPKQVAREMLVNAAAAEWGHDAVLTDRLALEEHRVASIAGVPRR